MNTPHERLTRTTFSLPLGEVHALVGGAVNARPLLFLHGFPDHPPTDDFAGRRRVAFIFGLKEPVKAVPCERTQPAQASTNIFGFFLAMNSSFLAAPEGRRVPYSQLMTLAGLTPRYAANTAWLTLSLSRMAAMSFG